MNHSERCVVVSRRRECSDVLSVKRLLIAAVLLLTVPALAWADGTADAAPGTPAQWTTWAEAASRSAAYGEASAHEPRFKDRTLWPMLQGSEPFAAQPWTGAGRVYRWAHPGQDGGVRWRGALDPTDPGNWIDAATGKAPNKLILDEHTDLVLPASPKPYKVGFRGTSVAERLRHLTVNAGAAFIGGGDGVGRTIYGNVWVKRGGGMYAQGATRFAGEAHTFFRNDNTYEPGRGDGGQGTMCSQYFTFEKAAGASVEFLGHTTVLDEFRIHEGLVIVGRYSKLQPGRHAQPSIARGGTLALLDHAYFGKWVNDWGQTCLVVEGVVQGGTPDRPLRADAVLGVGSKNFTNARPEFAVTDKLRERALPRAASLVLQPGSALVAYSEDPGKARLQVTSLFHLGYTGTTRDLTAPADPVERREAAARHPEQAQLWAWFESLPQAIDIYVGDGVQLRHVTFDHVHEGGILTPDPAGLRERMEDVVFGPHCRAEGDALFSRVDAVDKSGRY